MKRSSWKDWAAPRRVLPLMVFLAVAMVGLRVNDMWDAASGASRFNAVTEAFAEAKPEALTPAPPAPPAPAKTEASKAEAASPPVPTTPPEEEQETTGSEMALIKELSARREQLDKRAKELDTRQSLIRVAEQRVDQKIKEMETLRTQLQSMVNQASEAQQVQIDNLVKIYETMKPKEAARIFETLELPTLLNVVQRMKPARTAPIMAEMAPAKAKEITVALTRQDQLPQVK